MGGGQTFQNPQDVLVENPSDNRPQDVSQGSSGPQASQEKGFTIVELPSASDALKTNTEINKK